jgi:hypothetical protein
LLLTPLRQGQRRLPVVAMRRQHRDDVAIGRQPRMTATDRRCGWGLRRPDRRGGVVATFHDHARAGDRGRFAVARRGLLSVARRNFMIAEGCRQRIQGVVASRSVWWRASLASLFGRVKLRGRSPELVGGVLEAGGLASRRDGRNRAKRHRNPRQWVAWGGRRLRCEVRGEVDPRIHLAQRVLR